jgi:hypothetical protein
MNGEIALGRKRQAEEVITCDQLLAAQISLRKAFRRHFCQPLMVETTPSSHFTFVVVVI